MAATERGLHAGRAEHEARNGRPPAGPDRAAVFLIKAEKHLSVDGPEAKAPEVRAAQSALRALLGDAPGSALFPDVRLARLLLEALHEWGGRDDWRVRSRVLPVAMECVNAMWGVYGADRKAMAAAQQARISGAG